MNDQPTGKWRVGRFAVPAYIVWALMLVGRVPADEKSDEPAIRIDKEKKSISVACKIAPRKLPNLNEIYPIEVVATLPTPDGKKAHETVVTFHAKPSEIHRALESLGLKPGKPARGEDSAAEGPELRISLAIPSPDGQPKLVPIEKALVDRKTGKPMPVLKWLFTGSAMKESAPGQTEKQYGADVSGTLIAIFPVTDETVIQTNLTMKDEPILKLETNKKILPAEGMPVRLVIEVK